MIKSYFDQDIRPELLRLINNSQSELTAAVAWFTDSSVFSALSAALARGVKLRLLTQDDEINNKAPFNLGELARKRAQIWQWNPALLGTMHHKFLVVDQRIVMVGSYNWTLSAARFNRENANVFDGPETPVKDYMDVFDEMCHQATCHADSPGISGIFHIDVKAKLRVQIRQIETEISELEAEKTDLEGIINRFTVKIQQRLGHLILKRIELETELAKIRAELTKRRSDFEKYEHKKEDFEATFNTQEKNKDKKIPELSEDDQLSIKKMHRETVMIIHPDRFFDQPEMEAKANEITAKLNEAYKNNDIETVRQIWQSVKDGTVFGTDVSQIEDITRLEEILEKMKLKRDQLLATINSLQLEEFFRFGSDESVWEDYFNRQEEQLIANIEVIEREISTMLNQVTVK